MVKRSWEGVKRAVSWCGLWLPYSNYAFGVFLIVTVAIIWVVSSLWIQYIYGNLEYNKPYFLTYFNTFGFSVWNFGYIFRRRWRGVLCGRRDTVAKTPKVGACVEEEPVPDPMEEVSTRTNPPTSEPCTGRSSYPTAELATPRSGARCWDSCRVCLARTCPGTKEYDAAEGEESGVMPDTEPYHMRRLWWATLYFCPLWFIANSLFNASLTATTVSTNTILSSTSSVWTLVLSFFILGQRARIHHFGAVLLCVGGSIMVGFATGSNQGHSTPYGMAAASVSAFFYAAYTVALKRQLPDERHYSMGMVFGLLGVVNTLIFWPGFLILHYTGTETFLFPPKHTIWPLVVNALVGTSLSDVLWARGVVLTSPLVATVGLSLTIPLAMVLDFFIKSHTFTPLYFGGALTVTAGFVLCNI